MRYSVVYSDRRTMAITVREGQVIVRAPKGTSKQVIEGFIRKHVNWINEKIKLQAERASKFEALTDSEISRLKVAAKSYFANRTREMSESMGIKYSRIEITAAKTKHGSCNSKGVLRFNFRLMLYPEEAREYVIVHELCHIIHPNHSKDFYNLVLHFMPDYKARAQLLKK